MPEHPDRRPLASRDTRLAARTARWLTDSGITPNRISQASMVFAALAGGTFWLSGEAAGWLRGVLLVLAAAGCQLRLACNLLDGMVAVEGGKGAPDGPFWNEAPDRVSDVLILAGMGLGAGVAALGWAAAALAVLTAYVRELRVTAGLPSDFSGPMAKPQRMALATGAALMAVVLPAVGGIGTLEIALWIIALGTMATALRRAWRILAALRKPQA